MKNFILGITVLAIIALVTGAPAHAQYKCFFGNLHAHTSYSDGVSTPDTAYAYARNTAHIDVEALTEHNNGGVSNGSSYSITPAHYQNERLVADTMTAPGQFVALAGFEIGNEGSNGFGHICTWEEPALSPYFNTQGELVDCYRWIAEQGAPAQFNHPGAGTDNIFNNLHYYPELDPSVGLMEVVNNGTIYEGYYLQALTNGWQIGATANQDNHHANWGNQVAADSTIPLTGIWADTLTKASILSALRAHRTAATKVARGDRIQLSLTADDHWMGERYLRGKGSVALSIEARSLDSAFTKLYLYADMQIADSLLLHSNQTIVQWSLHRDIGVGLHNYFVKAYQSGNGRAWSSPVFIEVAPPKQDEQVVTWPTPIGANGARIAFLPVDGATSVSISIYNLAGARVWHTVRSNPAASIYWDGADDRGHAVANGVYVIFLEQAGPNQTVLYKGKTMVSR